MKRLLMAIFLIASIAVTSSAQSRELDYMVNWKWGLVDISAGLAHVHTDLAGNAYSASLYGHSIPWEGRIYQIDETLRASASPEALDVEYINGIYKKPRVHAAATDTTYRDILGQGTLSASPKTMEAVSVMAHMLGLFYYAGVIDFSSLKPGAFISIPYRSDTGNESVLQIEYLGEVNDCYSIKFKFSFCQYHVDCLIDKATLTPQSFTADIAIGHVEMQLAE